MYEAFPWGTGISLCFIIWDQLLNSIIGQLNQITAISLLTKVLEQKTTLYIKVDNDTQVIYFHIFWQILLNWIMSHLNKLTAISTISPFTKVVEQKWKNNLAYKNFGT